MSLTFNEITERVNKLQDHYKTEPSALKERLIYAYYQKTLGELSQICQENTANTDNNLLLTKRLEDFLARNWQLIKNTALCYTALPESDITKLLCDLAKLVVAKKK